MARIGAWAFIIGLIISVFLGLFDNSPSTLILTILIVLGLIIGFLNITEKEVQGFLLACISLLLVGSVLNISVFPLLGDQIQGIITNIILFIAPAALVVAIKQVFLLAKD